MTKAFIIAEAGVNHGGDFGKARELVEAARESGASAVKFQIYDPVKLGRGIDARLSFAEYEKLADMGIEMFASVFSVEDAEFIDPLVKRFKVAASEVGNIKLLTYLNQLPKRKIISRNPDSAICCWLNSRWDILHCISEYPCKNPQLKYVGSWGGYSDHCIGIEAAVISRAVGADIIEKHFCITRDCVDGLHSATPDEFKELVRRVREIEGML